MSQNPGGVNPNYQPPHPDAAVHPAIQYAPIPTQKPEPSTVVKIGVYLIYAVALYMVVRGIAGIDDVRFQAYHTENGHTTTTSSSTGVGYVINAIFTTFTIILGYFYSKGHGWARITALVLGIIGTIRDVLALLVAVLATSVVNTASAQLDMDQEVSVPGYFYVVYGLGIILQIAVVVFMLRGGAGEYTRLSRLWRMYQQGQNPQPVYHPADAQPQQYDQPAQTPWQNGSPNPSNPTNRDARPGNDDNGGYRLN